MIGGCTELPSLSVYENICYFLFFSVHVLPSNTRAFSNKETSMPKHVFSFDDFEQSVFAKKKKTFKKIMVYYEFSIIISKKGSRTLR